MIVTMVITGTLNTISATLQIARPSRNKFGKLEYFEHYYVQTLFMMLGETLCMVAYLILKWYHKDHPEKVDGEAKPMNPLVMWPAAFMDIVATSLGYMGLAFMQNAGMFQMLRVTPMIWCGLLSMPLLKQKLKWYNWFGMLVVACGLIIKAIPLFFPLPEDKGLDWKEACVEQNMRHKHLTNLTLWGQSPLNGAEAEDNESSCNSNCLMGIGAAMVIVGEFFHGLQFVYEQKYMNKYDLHPLKVVGFEGISGVLTLCVLLWPMYFITFDKTGIMEGVALGPEGRFEDAIDAFVMIFNGNQGHSGPLENDNWLLGWTLGNMCSIAVFNWAGITVAKELNATTRAVLDQLRIVLIWGTFLIPFGPFLCRVQDYFHWTAPIGLSILVCGVWIYNDVIVLPLIRKCLGTSKSSDNDEESDE